MRKMTFLYGFLVWLVPFVVALCISPLRTSARPLFESIMPVVLTLSVVVCLILDFRRLDRNFLREGIVAGLVWLAMSLALDFPMFSAGPMKMSLAEYMMDIGLTYLIIPSITIAFGYLADQKLRAAR